MSTSAPAPAPVMLSQDQADKILQYAIEHRMYETGAEGLSAVDPQTRMNDAATLAFQAKRAFENGNQSDAVKEVLFIAEVDMSAPQQPAATTSAPAAPAAAPPTNGASQYAGHSVEQLEQALEVFRSSPPNPAIQAEIQQIEAVLAERRGSAQATPAPQPPQEVPPAPQPPAPAAASGTSAPVSVGQPAAPPAPAAAEPHVPPQPDVLPPIPGRPNPGVISPGGQPDTPGTAALAPGADAGTVPGSQAPQPVPEGSQSPAQAPAQNGARLDLERQLTFEMMQSYGLTVESIGTLTDDQLRSIIANPDGQSQPAPAAAAPPAVSPERESLEAQVTGPMLKAWGRGRRDVPSLSDDDLRTMVENPGGPSNPQGPATATAPAVPTPTPPAPQVSSPQPEAAVATPEQPPQPPVTAAPAPSVPASRPQSDAGRVGEAMEIIQREHLPVPPDIEEVYRLPNDVSKVSDDELRSLHARAHAVEARCNWIISEQYEDEIEDLEKLLRDRERQIRHELPDKDPEGKKWTKVAIEELVANDHQIVELHDRLRLVKRDVGKIKVIRDNAHRDCERLSRQWSMRFREENFSPTR